MNWITIYSDNNWKVRKTEEGSFSVFRYSHPRGAWLNVSVDIFLVEKLCQLLTHLQTDENLPNA